MKKFFSLFCALVVALSAVAAPAVLTEKVLSTQKIEVKKAPRLEKAAQKVTLAARAPKAKAEELASGTFYTVGGTFYANGSSGWVDITSDMASIEVLVDGENVSITGLAYWFKEGTITGTIEDNVLTFPNGQLVGTDEYGDEFLVGSDDGETVTDIIFVYDPDAQTLTASTTFILESAAADAISAYCYWNAPVFSVEEPAEPELVELPEGAEVIEYTMEFTKSDGASDAKAINVAVVGDEVFFQGMSAYIPESWVVGTKEGNVITFAAGQFVGEYAGFTSFFFYGGDAQFIFDEENDTYTAEGLVCGVLGNQYYDGYYQNPVLSRSIAPDFDNPIEVAIVSATHKFESQYQDVIYTLSNEAADTVIQLDIYLAEGLEDVELGVVYTMADMETSSNYTFIEIDGEATSLKSVEFVKTLDGELSHFEATIVDMRSNVFHFACSIEEIIPTPVVVPEGLETATYKFVGQDTYFNEEVTKFVEVGFDEDTVYILGMSDYVTDAWIKGIKKAEGVYEFDACLLGVYESWMDDYELNALATSMEYDAELDQFTCAEFQSEGSGYLFDEFADIVLTRFNEVAATPADPEITGFVFADTNYPSVSFNIPLVGTEGEDLNPAKLSYMFFIQRENEESPLVLTTDLYVEIEEDMTEIPYEFSDGWDIYNYKLYLNQGETEARTWEKLGLQTIYRGGNEEHKSNIVWFDVKAYWESIDNPQAIDNVDAAAKATKVVRNGQLFIEKNGVIYNVLGATVK